MNQKIIIGVLALWIVNIAVMALLVATQDTADKNSFMFGQLAGTMGLWAYAFITKRYVP